MRHRDSVSPKSAVEIVVTRERFFAVCFAALWLVAAVPSLAVDPPPYASAGIGDDDPLAPLTGDYNLQLVFATQGSGDYLADVGVLISDANKRPLLSTLSPGPLFYVRLPAGNYQLRVEFAGVAQARSVTIGGLRRQSVYFYWPGAEAAAEARK